MSTSMHAPIPSTSANPPLHNSIPNNPPIPQTGPFSFFNWRNTTSTLKNRPFMGRSTPLSSSPNSLFVDTKNNKIDDRELYKFFGEQLLGVSFNPPENFIELTFVDNNTFQKYLDEPITINSKIIHLSPPKNFNRKKLVIHLHGLPIIHRNILHEEIEKTLLPYGHIIEIAPVLITDTHLLTPKWDVVIEPHLDKDLPTTVEILNTVIVLTWVNSPETCLYCKKVGHLHSKCPAKSLPQRSLINPANTASYADTARRSMNQNLQPNRNPNTNDKMTSSLRNIPNQLSTQQLTNTNKSPSTTINSLSTNQSTLSSISSSPLSYTQGLTSTTIKHKSHSSENLHINNNNMQSEIYYDTSETSSVQPSNTKKLNPDGTYTSSDEMDLGLPHSTSSTNQDDMEVDPSHHTRSQHSSDISQPFSQIQPQHNHNLRSRNKK